eukprot:m.204792 g.204792  ORF g.204792 m.204792 type:complete len:72 (-) comp53876_c0_seq1:2641-2856(-)
MLSSRPLSDQPEARKTRIDFARSVRGCLLASELLFVPETCLSQAALSSLSEHTTARHARNVFSSWITIALG